MKQKSDRIIERTNLDPVIISESRTEGIRFEHHKEKIVDKFTSSMKNQK